MIKFLENLEINRIEKLCEGHYKRKILSNFYAYGIKYDFLRFYEIISEKENCGIGLISIFNSSMVIELDFDKEIPYEEIGELMTFISFNSPLTIEMPFYLAIEGKKHLRGVYLPCDRTEFAFTPHEIGQALVINEAPKLDDVYAILEECFPIVRNSYHLWLTDTSHRIRHGLSQAFLVENKTTATLQYMVNNIALIGHVGTFPSHRGKHYAREMLYSIGDKLFAQGLEVRLFARNHRVSYYNEIGFLPIGSDIVFELDEKV